MSKQIFFNGNPGENTSKIDLSEIAEVLKNKEINGNVNIGNGVQMIGRRITNNLTIKCGSELPNPNCNNIFTIVQIISAFITLWLFFFLIFSAVSVNYPYEFVFWLNAAASVFPSIKILSILLRVRPQDFCLPPLGREGK